MRGKLLEKFCKDREKLEDEIKKWEDDWIVDLLNM